MTCQRPSLRAETSTKIWMNGLYPNYNTTRPNSALNYGIAAEMSERDTVYFASRRHLGFAVPTRGNTSSWRVAWITADLFYLLIIHLSLYSVLISFAHNLHYKRLWVCSSRPLELRFVRAWDCCQQDAAALADQHGDCKVRGYYQ